MKALAECYKPIKPPVVSAVEGEGAVSQGGSEPTEPGHSGKVLQMETVELVLPPHTNHHGTTFGGQIMAWLSTVSLVCATRFARALVDVLSVDDVHFVGPSHVGDRVRITARVNYCDGKVRSLRDCAIRHSSR